MASDLEAVLFGLAKALQSYVGTRNRANEVKQRQDYQANMEDWRWRRYNRLVENDAARNARMGGQGGRGDSVLTDTEAGMFQRLFGSADLSDPTVRSRAMAIAEGKGDADGLSDLGGEGGESSQAAIRRALDKAEGARLRGKLPPVRYEQPEKTIERTRGKGDTEGLFDMMLRQFGTQAPAGAGQPNPGGGAPAAPPQQPGQPPQAGQQDPGNIGGGPQPMDPVAFEGLDQGPNVTPADRTLMGSMARNYNIIKGLVPATPEQVQMAYSWFAKHFPIGGLPMDIGMNA